MSKPSAQLHGGEAAVKRLSDGQPFEHLAREVELEVLAELGFNGADGVLGVLVANAARLEAASRLFWMAGMGAARAGNLEGWERFMQRFGWLAGKSARALKDLADEMRQQPGILDYESILEDGTNGRDPAD